MRATLGDMDEDVADLIIELEEDDQCSLEYDDRDATLRLSLYGYQAKDLIDTLQPLAIRTEE